MSHANNNVLLIETKGIFGLINLNLGNNYSSRCVCIVVYKLFVTTDFAQVSTSVYNCYKEFIELINQCSKAI